MSFSVEATVVHLLHQYQLQARATPEVVADKNNNGITSKAELKTLTKVQLFEFAEKRSLKVKKSGTKAQVINEIHSQLK